MRLNASALVANLREETVGGCPSPLALSPLPVRMQPNRWQMKTLPAGPPDLKTLPFALVIQRKNPRALAVDPGLGEPGATAQAKPPRPDDDSGSLVVLAKQPRPPGGRPRFLPPIPLG